MSDSFSTLWTVARQAPLSMGILQARILDWVAMPCSRGSSQPRGQIQASHIWGRFFTTWTTRFGGPLFRHICLSYPSVSSSLHYFYHFLPFPSCVPFPPFLFELPYLSPSVLPSFPSSESDKEGDKWYFLHSSIRVMTELKQGGLPSLISFSPHYMYSVQLRFM